jgi:hypothetical protein
MTGANEEDVISDLRERMIKVMQSIIKKDPILKQ